MLSSHKRLSPISVCVCERERERELMQFSCMCDRSVGSFTQVIFRVHLAGPGTALRWLMETAVCVCNCLVLMGVRERRSGHTTGATHTHKEEDSSVKQNVLRGMEKWCY